MKYFTLQELLNSDTAAKLHVKNEPTPFQKENLRKLVENTLDPIREQWGMPIRVTSGYRSPYINRMVGGSATSQHMQGKAADIQPWDKKFSATKLFWNIDWKKIPFDQLIVHKTYIHISFDEKRQRRQIIYQAV